jgi:hypothetical protein
MRYTKFACAALLFLLTACGNSGEQPVQEFTTQTLKTEAISEPPDPSPEADSSGLSPQQIASLESLDLIDDYPLYTMYYYGSYFDSSVMIPDERLPEVVEDRGRAAWACSLFAALSDPESKLYGRNFDWEYSPAVLLFTDPPEGFASVSMVDIAYLGFGGSRGRELLDLPISERLRLLDSPYLPFDGMNEYGLAVGMAAVPVTEQPQNPENETIDSLMVIRLMLDGARTVDEALAIFRQYHLDWGSGPALHYLIADRTGRSILVEFWEGETVVIENQESWQAATNFLQSADSDDIKGNCSRYDTISEKMEATAGGLSLEGAMQLLAEVSQPNTQWSIVYGLSDGEIRIVMGQAYGGVITTQIELAIEE